MERGDSGERMGQRDDALRRRYLSSLCRAPSSPRQKLGGEASAVAAAVAEALNMGMAGVGWSHSTRHADSLCREDAIGKMRLRVAGAQVYEARPAAFSSVAVLGLQRKAVRIAGERPACMLLEVGKAVTFL